MITQLWAWLYIGIMKWNDSIVVWVVSLASRHKQDQSVCVSERSYREICVHLSPAGRAAHRWESSGALQVHQAPRVSEGGRQAALQRGSHQRHRPGHQTTAIQTLLFSSRPRVSPVRLEHFNCVYSHPAAFRRHWTTQSSCHYSLTKGQRLCFKTPVLSLASCVFISDVNEESRGSYSRESEIIALLYQAASLMSFYLF